MPPWNQMTPQQQQLFLSMLMGRGSAGMQFPQATASSPNAGVPVSMGMGQPGGMMNLPTTTANPLTSGLTNQAQSINPAIIQYLMGNQQPGAMQQPTLAQLLQMRGTGMGL